MSTQTDQQQIPPSIDSRIATKFYEFANDPYSFVLFAFPWGVKSTELRDQDGPDVWQTEALLFIRDQLQAGGDLGAIVQLAIASGHGIGKSAFLSWIVLWCVATKRNSIGVVTANTEVQLRTKTGAAMARWFNLFIGKKWFNLTATAIMSADPELARTWRIDFVPWSVANTEAFAGMHNMEGKRVLVLFDEASAIDDLIWQVAANAGTDSGIQFIWIAAGNPTLNSGMFYECFHRYRHRWHTMQIDSRSSKLTNKKKLQDEIDDHGLDSDYVKVRIRGMFPSMSALQFYSLADVDAAYNNVLRPEQFNFAPKILTLDPAWDGDDEMVFGLRQGLDFQVLRVVGKNDNDANVADQLARYEDEHKADAVFIDAGYGTGVVSFGRTMGRSWQLVWFSGKSADPGCLNKRSEMANELRRWLKEGGSIRGDNKLREEILMPQTLPRGDGVIQLESKVDIKKRLGRSPGRFDALLLSFAFPVVSKKMLHINNRGATQQLYKNNCVWG